MYNYAALDPAKCEFIEIARVDEISNGERLFFAIDNESIVLFNIGGQYYAIADICSHDGGPLGDGDVDGLEVACPRHGARFDIRTGKALSLPAIVDIPAYPIRIVGDAIQIGLPIHALPNA